MKIKFLLNKFSSKGFTLIELLVVIAIIGVLAAVLITAIDPLDKIRLSNDTGVISTITQLGNANTTYSVAHNNTYVGGAFAASVTDLNTAGEIKYSSVTAPTGYTYTYFSYPSTCTTAAATCTNYAYYVNLLSKKYTTTLYYVHANGKGCFSNTAPTSTTVFNCP